MNIQAPAVSSAPAAPNPTARVSFYLMQRPSLRLKRDGHLRCENTCNVETVIQTRCMANPTPLS